jgi:2-methylfumaryl-CoA hydratase
MGETIEIAAPYFEDFKCGQEFDAPAVTLTSGHAAIHQAVTGDRLRLTLDHHASRIVTGTNTPLAHPLLVTNIAIGQSTWASQQAKANLFYRGLISLRQAHIGETLYTKTKVVGLRQNLAQAGRSATGLVVLEVITRNQDAEELLRFWRCPMVPCRDPESTTGSRDNLDKIGTHEIESSMTSVLPAGWQISGVAARWSGRKAADLQPGMHLRIEPRDTVTGAPELVRMTLNMAMMHIDAEASYIDKRLVYGGHTLGIAFAQVTRALPNLLTILGWESVEHRGPVAEGDRIRSDLTVLDIKQSAVGAMLKLLVRSYATRNSGCDGEQGVLDWMLWVLCA